MVDFHPVTWDRHARKHWNLVRDYVFARSDNMVQLSATEAPRALMWMPLAFMSQGDAEVLIGIQGVIKGQNQLVDKNGTWLATYVPAVYRGYPFRIASTGEQNILCVDENSGLVTESEGEPFFTEDKAPSAMTEKYLKFLAHVQGEINHTKTLIRNLRELGLLEDWVVTFEDQGNKERIQLSRVNEGKLNDLPSDQFLQLRTSGALLLAYCQLLSMQNLQLLGRLANNKSTPAEHGPALFEKGSSETISFNWD